MQEVAAKTEPALTIELDQVGPVPTGGRLTGRLVTRSAAALQAPVASVTLSCTVSGGRATSEGPSTTWTAPVDAAGGGTDIPFALEVPAGPLSRDGRLVSVAWALDAEIRGTGKKPRRASAEVVVVSPVHRGGGDDAGYRGEKVERTLVDDEIILPPAKPLSPAVRVFLAVPILVTVAYASMMLSAGLRVSPLWSFTVVGIAAVLMWLASAYLDRAAKASLGEPTITAEPAIVAAGDEVDVTLTVAPDHWQDVTSVTLKLRCLEVARPPPDASSRIDLSEITFSSRGEVVTVSKELTFQPGVPKTFRAKLTVPSDASPSFAVAKHELRWEAAAVFLMPRDGGERIAAAPIEVVP